MRKTSGAERICTVCEQIGDIGDSVKGSSSRMKNKVGAQKGAFIKMKQENVYTYQWLYRLCYVPIIGTHTTKSIKNNNLKSVSLSSYDLLLRDSMTNSCRYG